MRERWVSGGESFKDGWRLSFSGPIGLTVQYLDQQFEVNFERGGVMRSYREIDHGLFGTRSGFHGDMFPPNKLESAIKKIAADIREHYGLVLSGDDDEWERLRRLRAEERKSGRLP